MGQQSRPQSKTSASGRTGLDDLSYDLVTILHQKSKGMEAYEKYSRDAQSDPEVMQLLNQIRDQDLRAIEQLKSCVARLLGASGSSQSSGAGDLNAPRPDGNRSSAV